MQHLAVRILLAVDWYFLNKKNEDYFGNFIPLPKFYCLLLWVPNDKLLISLIGN